jgi:tRNA-dihydrouridine synthase C
MNDLTLALAPMEGVTDDVVRDLLSRLGGVDYCVTEFVRISDVVLSPRVLLRECPELAHGGRTLDGTPVHVQLLGGDPARMGASAAVAAEMGALAIDLNFGCPAPTVNRHDGGATLLKDPTRVERVTAAVRAAVPPAIPVSAKVRLGWDDPDAIVSIARAAEAGGASWLTIHGRTRVQGYAPPADWVRIGRARAAVSIPVVANGDLNSPEDLARCREITGCERFMLGRGAIVRPELFRAARGLEAGSWCAAQRFALLREFIDTSLARGPDRERVTLARLKQWCRYMAPVDPALRTCFESLKRLEDVGAARALLEQLATGSADAAA